MTARPGPPPNPVTAPFWEALAQGRLILQRCGRCGSAQHYPRGRCATCWSDELTWTESAGTGEVWTWTVVHRAGHPAWQEATPYAVVIVTLDEGPRLVTSWVGALDDLALGLRVRVGSVQSGEHTILAARAEREPEHP